MPTVPPEAFAPPAELSLTEKITSDPLANGVAILVLLAMIAAIVAALWPASWQQRLAASPWPARIIPFLAVVGLGVAMYLGYIEASLKDAFCGPVGDCNAVQQSSYARLFGIPIAWLGMLGYLVILALWAVVRFASRQAARWAWAFLFVVAVAGVLFSIYLTFLEPFVIGATCMWCVTSAVLMTLIMLLSAGHGHEALREEPRPEPGAGEPPPPQTES